MENLNRDVLVKITGIEEHSTKIATINVQSKEYGNLVINFGSDTTNLKFKYPPVGVFQHKTDALVFLRRPQRQWRRGICSDNSTLQYTHRLITGKTVGWAFEELQAAFDKKVLTLDDALQGLAKRQLRSAALNNNFSLVLSPNTDPRDHLLLHWQDPIARVSEETGKITKIINPNYKSIMGRVYDNLK